MVKAAPTLEPQARISLNRIRRTLEAMHIPVKSHDFELKAYRAMITFASADPEASVVGLTASLLLEVDEAQDVQPDVYDVRFDPMRASTGAPVVMWGTAWSDTSLLARSRAVATKAIRVTWDRVADELPAYGDFVRKQRDRLGADNPLFRSQYELVDIAGAGGMFSGPALALLQGNHPPHPTPQPGRLYVAGLDIAGTQRSPTEQRDRSVMAIGAVTYDAARTPSVELAELYTFPMTDAEVLRESVVQLCALWGVVAIDIDATGIGAPTAEGIEKRLGQRAEPVPITGPEKSRLGFALLAAAQTGRLKVFAPPHAERDELLQQFRLAKAEYLPGLSMRWGVPERDGHDDHLFASALMVRAAGRGVPRVARGR